MTKQLIPPLCGLVLIFSLDGCTSPDSVAPELQGLAGSSARLSATNYPSLINLSKTGNNNKTIIVPAKFSSVSRRIWLQNGNFSVQTDVDGNLGIYNGSTKIKTITAPDGKTTAAAKISATDAWVQQDHLTSAQLLSSYSEGGGPMPYIPTPSGTRSPSFILAWNWSFSAYGLQSSIAVCQNIKMNGMYGYTQVGGYDLMVNSFGTPQAQQLQLIANGQLQIISNTGSVLWQSN